MNFRKNVIILISTWWGSGFIPFAPGTFGSLAAIPIAILLRNASVILKAIVLLLIILVGVIVTKKAHHVFKDNDPKMVVIDEVAGMLVAVLFLPFEWRYIALAFFIFRILDIIKPFPIRNMEGIKGGIGIMLDDIVAGAITYILMLVFLIIFGHGDF